jgi:hypothetical protein
VSRTTPVIVACANAAAGRNSAARVNNARADLRMDALLAAGPLATAGGLVWVRSGLAVLYARSPAASN